VPATSTSWLQTPHQDRPDLRRHHRPRQHLRRGALLRRHEEEEPQAHPRLRTLHLQRRDHRRESTPTPTRSTTTCSSSPRTKPAIATSSASPAKPRCTASTRSPASARTFLAKHTEGLIGFSGCLAGEVSQHIIEGNYDSPRRPPVTSRPCSAAATSSSRSRTTVSARQGRYRGDVPPGKRPRHPAHRHQRLALHRGPGLPRPRSPALRADRRIDERSQALQVRHAGVLHQVRRRDAPLFVMRPRSAPAPCSFPSAAISSSPR
jgi:hypothetical protein